MQDQVVSLPPIILPTPETPRPGFTRVPVYTGRNTGGGGRTVQVGRGESNPAGIHRPAPQSILGADPVELHFRLIDYFGGVGGEHPTPDGRIFFCDPDEYPIRRHDELDLALEQYELFKATPDHLAPFLKRLGLEDVAEPTPAQKIAIYQAVKRIRAVQLAPAAQGYTFQLIVFEAIPDYKPGWHGVRTTGIIQPSGVFQVVRREVVRNTSCGRCLAESTYIDTPAGALAVETLREGMLVWTEDATGERIAAPIRYTARLPILADHVFIRLRLSDGRELWASPGHPLADGRLLAEIGLGDWVDGTTVAHSEPVQTGSPATYDILPDSVTGFYWAEGVKLASTLNMEPLQGWRMETMAEPR